GQTARHLVRVPVRVPGRARHRRPQSAQGLRQRPQGDRLREARPRPDRAVGPALRRLVALSDEPRLVDVLELGVHGRRPRAALGLPAPARGLHPVPERDPGRERDRPRRLCAAAHGPAAHVPRPRLRRHALAVREPQPRQRPDQLRRQPICGDAEPARGGRPDRRHRARRGLPQLVREGRLGAVAVLGLVRSHGDRQPLLARRAGGRGRRPCRPRGGLRTGPAPTTPPAGRRLAARIDRSPSVRGLSRREAGTVRSVNRTAAVGSVKQGYTDGTRRLASRYVRRLARTRVSPNALTTAGFSLCAAAAVAIPFEDRNKYLFYWLGAALFIVGSILDILDGALARESDRATPFGEFLDSLADRVSEGF